MTTISHANFIAASAKRLLQVGILSNDITACALEAKRIYKIDARGMWRAVQSQARLALESAIHAGITLEKPYFINNGVVYTLSSVSFVPAFGKERSAS